MLISLSRGNLFNAKLLLNAGRPWNFEKFGSYFDGQSKQSTSVSTNQSRPRILAVISSANQRRAQKTATNQSRAKNFDGYFIYQSETAKALPWNLRSADHQFS